MFQRVMFVLAVPDFEVSCKFYRDVLGFEILEMGDPGWRMYVRGACKIMAGECPDAMPPAELGDHSYFAYLVEDDVAQYFEQVKSNGAEIIKPLRDEPWGMREFGIRTADGHRIMIGQDLKM